MPVGVIGLATLAWKDQLPCGTTPEIRTEIGRVDGNHRQFRLRVAQRHEASVGKIHPAAAVPEHLRTDPRKLLRQTMPAYQRSLFEPTEQGLHGCAPSSLKQ